MGAATQGANAGAALGVKTRAGAGLGIAGIMGDINRAAQTVAAKVSAGAHRVNPAVPLIQASKPIPPPTAHFIGYGPQDFPPNQSPNKSTLGADAWKLLPGMDAFGKGFSQGPVKRRANPATPADTALAGVNAASIGSPTTTDPGWQAADALNKGAGRALQGVGAGTEQGFPERRAKTQGAGHPDDAALAEIQKQVNSALSDNTWSDQERADIVQTYRNFWLHFTGNDDSLRQLNNFGVQSAYRRYLQQKHDRDNANSDQADNNGDFFDVYNGPLSTAADDQYGPGFMLAQDEQGYFKIESLKDLQHEIEVEARKNPAFAAKMIARMAAWGSYGGAQEKYSSQNVVFDKNGNPVTARWTKDDQTALKQFLTDVSKDQEMATSASELQPWDTIMDKQAAQNDTVASNPSYGKQGGGGGYRRYGGGGYGGGGGGGGGVSYTDADQLKQLINGIARSRMGMALSDDQINAFVADYHSKEAAFVNARMSGQDGQQLDPESQAAAWLESHFRDPMAAQQANTYVSGLANFLLGGSFGSNS